MVPQHNSQPPSILAYTAEDDRHRPVRTAAVERARGDGSRLILYDVDAAGIFQKPLPTDWSGEGAETQFGDLLGPADLARLGRHAVAGQVTEAREAGVDAWGWLPGGLAAGDLSEYVQRVGAVAVFMPDGRGRTGGLLERFVRADLTEVREQLEPLGIDVVAVA